jgi:hypothetical protein
MPTVSSKDLAPNKTWESANPTDNTLVITIDATAPPKVGQTYVFRLEVFDDSQNKSTPVQASVSIIDNVAPTAIITPASPIKVPFNAAFTLSGASSTDAGGGKIARYVWTLVQ